MKFAYAMKAAAAILPLAALALCAPARAGTLKYPYGLAVDQGSGKLYVADPGASQVAAYNPISNAISTFVAQSNPFSLAVNSSGLVYVGVVGANSQIKVYNPQGQTINALPVPPNDSPITMAFDSDNILYQSNGRTGNTYGPGPVEINSYSNDLAIQYSQYVGVLNPFTQLQTYTALAANARYALAYDNGRIFVLADTNTDRPNVYDAQTLLTGGALDISTKFQNALRASGDQSWAGNHHITITGSTFAAAVDANHNIFYTDPDNKVIAVTGIGGTPKVLLTNLASQPYGIAYDKARSRLYVSFPGEHLIRAYAVTYTTQNGIKNPALSSPPALIQ